MANKIIMDNQSIDSSLDFPGNEGTLGFIGVIGDQTTLFIDGITELASAQNVVSIANGDAEIADFVLPSSGTYRVLVDGIGDTTGDFTLEIN